MFLRPLFPILLIDTPARYIYAFCVFARCSYSKLILVVALGILAGCGGGNDTGASISGSGPAAALSVEQTTPSAQPQAEIDLTPDIQVSEDIRLLATSLGSDPLRIFEHLRNNFAFEPYYFGSLKGSQETLLQRAGNDYDLASLLIALLNSVGIEARYAQGTIIVPIAEAMSWLGVQDPTTAEKVLQAAERTPTSSGFKAKLINNGTAIEMPHVWVEASLGQGWTALDPSFKFHTISPGRNIAQEAGLSAQQWTQEILNLVESSADGSAFVIPSVDMLTSSANARLATMRAYLRDREPGLTMRQIIGGKTIVPESLTALPAGLPFQLQGEVKQFGVIPESDRHYVNVFFQGINVPLALPEVASKRITISFAAATPEDQMKIDAGGGIVGANPSGLNMKSQLRVDGAVRAEGFGLGAGTSLTNFLQLTFRRGFLVQHSATHQNLAVGGQYAIVLNLQSISPDKLRKAADRLDAAAQAATGNQVFNDEMSGELLNALGLVYFSLQDRFAEYASGTQNALVFHGINEALIGFPTAIDSSQVPLRVSLDGLQIDNQINSFELFSRNNDIGFDAEALRAAIIYASSALEERFMNLAAGLPATSSTAVFQEASIDRGVFLRIDKANLSNMLPKLVASPLVKGDISSAVSQGRTVVIPAEPVTMMDWTGTGWIERPLGGASGGFKISGDIKGGRAIIDFFTQTAEQREEFRKQVAAFTTAFIRKNLLGSIDKTTYDTPASQAGAALGDYIAGILIYGDVRDAMIAGKTCAASGGKQGCEYILYSAAAAVPLIGDLKGTAKFISQIEPAQVAHAEAAGKALQKGISSNYFDAIVRKHAAGSNTKRRLDWLLEPSITKGEPRKSEFNEGIDIKALANQALELALAKPGPITFGDNGKRPGTVVKIEMPRVQFPDGVGVDNLGEPSWWVRVVIINDEITNIFPEALSLLPSP